MDTLSASQTETQIIINFSLESFSQDLSLLHVYPLHILLPSGSGLVPIDLYDEVQSTKYTTRHSKNIGILIVQKVNPYIWDKIFYDGPKEKLAERRQNAINKSREQKEAYINQNDILTKNLKSRANQLRLAQINIDSENIDKKTQILSEFNKLGLDYKNSQNSECLKETTIPVESISSTYSNIDNCNNNKINYINNIMPKEVDTEAINFDPNYNIINSINNNKYINKSINDFKTKKTQTASKDLIESITIQEEINSNSEIVNRVIKNIAKVVKACYLLSTISNSLKWESMITCKDQEINTISKEILEDLSRIKVFDYVKNIYTSVIEKLVNSKSVIEYFSSLKNEINSDLVTNKIVALLYLVSNMPTELKLNFKYISTLIVNIPEILDIELQKALLVSVLLYQSVSWSSNLQNYCNDNGRIYIETNCLETINFSELKNLIENDFFCRKKRTLVESSSDIELNTKHTDIHLIENNILKLEYTSPRTIYNDKTDNITNLHLNGIDNKVELVNNDLNNETIQLTDENKNNYNEDSAQDSLLNNINSSSNKVYLDKAKSSGLNAVDKYNINKDQSIVSNVQKNNIKKKIPPIRSIKEEIRVTEFTTRANPNMPARKSTNTVSSNLDESSSVIYKINESRKFAKNKDFFNAFKILSTIDSQLLRVIHNRALYSMLDGDIPTCLNEINSLSDNIIKRINASTNGTNIIGEEKLSFIAALSTRALILLFVPNISKIVENIELLSKLQYDFGLSSVQPIKLDKLKLIWKKEYSNSILQFANNIKKSTLQYITACCLKNKITNNCKSFCFDFWLNISFSEIYYECESEALFSALFSYFNIIREIGKPKSSIGLLLAKIYNTTLKISCIEKNSLIFNNNILNNNEGIKNNPGVSNYLINSNEIQKENVLDKDQKSDLSIYKIENMKDYNTAVSILVNSIAELPEDCLATLRNLLIKVLKSIFKPVKTKYSIVSVEDKKCLSPPTMLPLSLPPWLFKKESCSRDELEELPEGYQWSALEESSEGIFTYIAEPISPSGAEVYLYETLLDDLRTICQFENHEKRASEFTIWNEKVKNRQSLNIHVQNMINKNIELVKNHLSRANLHDGKKKNPEEQNFSETKIYERSINEKCKKIFPILVQAINSYHNLKDSSSSSLETNYNKDMISESFNSEKLNSSTDLLNSEEFLNEVNKLRDSFELINSQRLKTTKKEFDNIVISDYTEKCHDDKSESSITDLFSEKYFKIHSFAVNLARKLVRFNKVDKLSENLKEIINSKIDSRTWLSNISKSFSENLLEREYIRSKEFLTEIINILPIYFNRLFQDTLLKWFESHNLEDVSVACAVTLECFHGDNSRLKNYLQTELEKKAQSKNIKLSNL